EIKAGKWERMKFTDISVEYPELYHVWYNDISKCKCPEGECVSELFERVVDTFNKIVAENDDKTVMIATHATPIRALFCYFDGKDVSEMQNIKWVPNASVTVVECDGNSNKIVLRGEYSHLEKEGLVTELPKNI
ncbi:MAG: histidine phosphatase family protein, partial [Clostridia bacterium]|nr:histidine phosphatase family protein [Clostridia bacterium]